MSVTKPSKYPEWADGGSATITEPGTVKKQLGWVVEKPPYQFFNWLFNLIYQWIEWFDQGYGAIQHVTTSGTTTLALGSVNVFADATLGNQTFQLPDVTSDDGMEVCLVLIATASSHTATLLAQTGKTIVDAQSQILSGVGTSMTIVSYGGNWWIKS